MTEDSDAESIRQGRERRRAEERTRIDRDRRERELELARLRRAELLRSIEERRQGGSDEVGPPTRTGSSAEPTGASTDSPAQGRRADQPGPEGAPAPRPRSGGEPPVDRPIGRPVHSPALRQLMSLNPTEKFDIQLLNSLSFPGVVEEASSVPRLLEPLRHRAEVLMARVKAEVDDPLNAGAFLREQVLLWYQRSPEDPDWAARMPERWAGLFADSRATGGRLHRWLNARLLSVYEESLLAGRLSSRIRRGLRRSKVVEAAVTRTPLQQIQAESAQALLDDLAARPRSAEGPFPLVRLSELAVRRQVQTVNEALALLFSSHETGPFIVLHPNRYPDCDEVQIRPPTASAAGAALAYLLVSSRSSRRAAGRSGTALSSSSAAGDASDAQGPGPDEEEYDATSIWEGASVTAAAWRRLVEECRRDRKRLVAPPKDYRGRPSYAALRDLLLEDAEFRKAFLSTKWRGRPAGLPLLVTLVQKGSMTPEVGTDHEYLEAELGSLTSDDPDWRPTDGTWTFRGWTVTRDDRAAEGRRYTAARTPAAAP